MGSARPFRTIAVALIVPLFSLACGSGSSDRPSESKSQATAPPATPNVVIVLADDLGYGDLGCFGSPDIATPRLDGIAAEGARLTSFYAHGVCTPSRAALMTGRYGPRVGLNGALGPWADVGLHPAERTIAETLRTVSYRTALFGKWHLGDSPDQWPTAQGFDEFTGLLWGPTGNPTVTLDSESNTLTYAPDPVTQTARVTDDSIDFIERAAAANDPFLCVVSYVAPHKPAVASPAFVGQSADGRDYGDAVEQMDAAIGRIVDRIDALGEGERTLILFASDNGAALRGDPYQNGSNGTLRGGKGSSFEGGVRVPAIARWTGVIDAGRVIDIPLALTDIHPTIARFAGARLDPGLRLDGIDVGDLLMSDTAPPPNRTIHIASGATFEAVRRGRFKYRLGALYDVDAEPSESTDISAAEPAIAADLSAELAAITADVAANGRNPGVTQRRFRSWIAGARHPSPPLEGDLWRSNSIHPGTLRLEDSDPALDMDVISTVGAIPLGEALEAMRVAGYSDGLRWVRDDPMLAEGQPFTIKLWFRDLAASADRPFCLLDVGDDRAGLSVTVGDAGLVGPGEDPGTHDDVVVRMGGSASLTSASVVFDLDRDAATRFRSLTISLDESEHLVVRVDGFELGRAPADGVSWSPESPWAIFAPLGRVGGSGRSGGSQALPFETTEGRGEIAGLEVWDRALRAAETQAEYCRYLYVPYCYGGLHVGGESARLGFDGSFRLSENRLSAAVTDALPNATGFLMASPDMDRIPFGAGYLCLGAQALRFDAQLIETDAAGDARWPIDFGSAPHEFQFEIGMPWHFQFVYAGPVGSNTTNAVQVIFCPE